PRWDVILERRFPAREALQIRHRMPRSRQLHSLQADERNRGSKPAADARPCWSRHLRRGNGGLATLRAILGEGRHTSLGNGAGGGGRTTRGVSLTLILSTHSTAGQRVATGPDCVESIINGTPCVPIRAGSDTWWPMVLAHN